MAGRERLICASDELVDGGPGVRFEVDATPNEKVLGGTHRAGSGGTALAAFAVRHQGRVHAYLNRCGHISVELDWQHGQFFDSAGLYLICATHGALYDPATGRCVGGRCNGRGLTTLEVTERAGTVYLLEG